MIRALYKIGMIKLRSLQENGYILDFSLLQMWRPDNAGSIRVLVKAGFQMVQEETYHKVHINGKAENHIMFYLEE